MVRTLHGNIATKHSHSLRLIAAFCAPLNSICDISCAQYLEVDRLRIALRVRVRAIHACLSSVINVVFCIVESNTRNGHPGERARARCSGDYTLKECLARGETWLGCQRVRLRLKAISWIKALHEGEMEAAMVLMVLRMAVRMQTPSYFVLSTAVRKSKRTIEDNILQAQPSLSNILGSDANAMAHERGDFSSMSVCTTCP